MIKRNCVLTAQRYFPAWEKRPACHWKARRDGTRERIPYNTIELPQIPAELYMAKDIRRWWIRWCQDHDVCHSCRVWIGKLFNKGTCINNGLTKGTLCNLGNRKWMNVPQVPIEEMPQRFKPLCGNCAKSHIALYG